jgi:hypothetical protein
MAALCLKQDGVDYCMKDNNSVWIDIKDLVVHITTYGDDLNVSVFRTGHETEESLGDIWLKFLDFPPDKSDRA